MIFASMKRVTFLAALLMLFSCRTGEQEECAFIPDTSTITLQLTYQSLEDSLPSISSKADLVRFMQAHPGARDLFFNRGTYPDDSIFINTLYRRFSNPYLDSLLLETHRVFGNGAQLHKEFEAAYTNLKYYYPDAMVPRVESLISGLETDLFVTDSTVYVGLDYFLGSGAKYRPNNMYAYMLRRYTPQFIVPSVMLLTGVESRFNESDPDDRTVLAEMIAYGKAFYFAKRMLPCVADSLLMGYSAKELQGSLEFENLIWSRLVQDEVLFSTSHLVKQKFLAERPKTIEVGEECPGRIAQWIGWRIVEKYMLEHPDVTLPQLMASRDAQKIFRESGYKPQVVKLPSRTKS